MSEQTPEIRGFRFAGFAAGIKKSGLPDLALAVADRPVSCAALFTENLVQAAPLKIARERVAAGLLQAVLVNSGNANACTGKPGLEAAHGASSAVAEALGIDAGLLVPASTGVIGQVLPADKVVRAAKPLVSALGARNASDFAQAIMTTDQGPKLALERLEVGGQEVRVLGIAKGAGMIHPRMATTLAFVFTDAALPPERLQRALRSATDESFNIATVDGETSTNDMILALASGGAGAPELIDGTDAYSGFVAALTRVLRSLAEQIVADGEGAEHVAEVIVTGTAHDADARTIARRVATSLLVKTAMHGKDPNWGRILCAAGVAGVPFDPDVARIAIDDVEIVRDGIGLGAEAEQRAARIMQTPRYAIRVSLGAGPGRASYLTCDIGHRYIDVNAGYRS
jgi:glutamate N-acetyltransferase / amino-acid N-acetyltransferase